MTRVLIVLGILGAVLAWQYFIVRLSGRPWWNPLWIAFTLTAVALLYGIGALLGYDVPLHNPFIGRPATRDGHVVWAQVWFASMMGLASVVFWWQGLKRL